jgi:hypothetical protein
MFWRGHSSHSKTLIPNYLDEVDSAPWARQWKTYGAFFAILLLRHALPPPQLSMWVVMALLDAGFSPPFSMIRKFEPDLANRLAIWFERPEGPITSFHLGNSPNEQPTPIDWLIGEVFGNQTVGRPTLLPRYVSDDGLTYQLKNLPLFDMKAIDRAILSHFLFDDKDFLRSKEHCMFSEGWNLCDKFRMVRPSSNPDAFDSS